MTTQTQFLGFNCNIPAIVLLDVALSAKQLFRSSIFACTSMLNYRGSGLKGLTCCIMYTGLSVTKCACRVSHVFCFTATCHYPVLIVDGPIASCGRGAIDQKSFCLLLCMAPHLMMSCVSIYVNVESNCVRVFVALENDNDLGSEPDAMTILR